MFVHLKKQWIYFFGLKKNKKQNSLKKTQKIVKNYGFIL